MEELAAVKTKTGFYGQHVKLEEGPKKEGLAFKGRRDAEEEIRDLS